MTFRSYERYRDSGVEWLGVMPEHWDRIQLRRAISAPLVNGLFKSKDDFGRGTLLVNVFDVYTPDFKLRPDTLDRVECTTAEIAAYCVLPGDLFFVRSSLKQNGIAAAALAQKCSEPVVFECHLVRARPTPAIFNSRFASYLLNSDFYRSFLISRAKVTTMTTVDQETLASIDVLVPPQSEQSAIATFLDYQIAKLDVLVREQQRLIGLLKEKRQAVIAHAVTKGLDANAPMKPSGVGWLGEVPKHWDIKQLKWIVMFQRGHDLPSEKREDGDVPVVSSAGISGSHSRAMAHGPGIVTGRYGTIGAFHLVEGPYWPLNTTLYSIDLRGSHPNFLAYLLSYLSPLFIMNAVKSAVPGVDRNDIHPLPTAVPSCAEQVMIAVKLDRDTAKLDELIREAETAIALLQERRSALITAAVTGKIDVRGLVPVEAEAA
jgi:type I restriction enzyme, S subunit